MSGITGVLGVTAPGVDAPGVEAAGVEAAGVEALGVPPGVVPGVAGVTTNGAMSGHSAWGSSRGVDVINRASRIR